MITKKLSITFLLAFAMMFMFSFVNAGTTPTEEDPLDPPISIIDWTKNTIPEDDWTWDNVDEFITEGTFGKYIIKDSVIGIPTNTVKEIELTDNTFYCGDDCTAIFNITTYKNTQLIDTNGVLFYRLEDGKDPYLSNIRGYELYVKTKEGQMTETPIYQYVCYPTGEYSENGTAIEVCGDEFYDILREPMPEWIPYNYEVVPAGNYEVKLVGQKRPDWTYDWQIVTSGTITTEWATWGNISLGDQAEVILNSPANGAIAYSNPVTLNASANVTGGAYLVNATLFDNSTGSWGARNTSNITSFLIPFGNGLKSYYTLDETSGLIYDYFKLYNGTGVGIDYGLTGKINKSIAFNTPTGTDDRIDFSAVILDTPPFTVCAWINVTDTTGEKAIYSERQASGSGWGFEVFNDELRFVISNTATYDTTTANLNANTWYFVCVNSTASGQISFYKDGAYLQTNSTGTINGDTNSAIGGNTALSNFKGYIDEVSLWNRSISNSEISTLYNSGVGSRHANFSTSSTVTFTNTYPSGSTIKWNYQFCDSDGACGLAPSNYTFSIDSTAPNITLNYPTSIINYGAVNGNLQLNFTVTDDNLDDVWYNYNGTNITIAGAVSGVANLSNITLSTKKNVTIYANDTLGNLNTTTFSWAYKVFENSRSFTTPVVETTLDTFTINVTANTSLTSVYLNWNGTEYPASGSGGVYTTQLTIPPVSTTETIPVYWRFNYGGNNISSSSTNQVVNNLIFQLCNATVNKTLINFTTRSAENPFPIVNSTIKTNWILSASEGATPTTYNYEDLVIDNSSYAFCTDTNTTTFYVSAEVEYGSTNYATNFYFLEDAELIATDPENITLYLLNDSKATTTILRVQDTAQQPFEDYLVQIQSYDVGTGTFYTVGMAKTDYKGEDVVYLNWYDTLYKFIVLDTTGTVVKTTGTTKITETPTIIEIATDIEFVYDKFENFVYTLYFDNTTNNFVLTYTMPSGEVDSACLRVYKEDSLNQTLICDTCETSSSATVFCNIGSYGNGRFTAVFYALGSHKLIDWIDEYIGGRFQEQVYTALGNEDASFYAFLIAALVTVALFVNAVFGIVALMIGLIIASALGFTAIQWTEMMGIIAAGGVVIWIIKR